MAVILIPDGNIKGFKTEINGLVEEKHGYTRLRNSEARFVVAGANEFSTSQQKQIFYHFSALRIYNCIIVSQGNDVTDQEYSNPKKFNEVDTGMKLGMFTWLPFQSSDRCTEVNFITLLDSCAISEQGHLTKSTECIPRKISNNLNGCPMKAFVRYGKWTFTTNYIEHNDSNGIIVRSIEGLEYDLFKFVYEHMNMSFVHVCSPEDFGVENGIPVHKRIIDMVKKGADIFLVLWEEVDFLIRIWITLIPTLR